jgi:hypothetical protein
MPQDGLMSLLTAQFNSIRERVARVSTKPSRKNALVYGDQFPTSGICASSASSDSSRQSVQEMLLPRAVVEWLEPAPEIKGTDMESLWVYHLMITHVQKNLFDNEPLQLQFDFDLGRG